MIASRRGHILGPKHAETARAGQTPNEPADTARATGQTPKQPTATTRPTDQTPDEAAGAAATTKKPSKKVPSPWGSGREARTTDRVHHSLLD
jgi:hypothetical protein